MKLLRMSVLLALRLLQLVNLGVIQTTGCGLDTQAILVSYRVYCGPDGKPAEFSKDNIPYKPKHHLPIQLDGVENNDFTMIFGYPGSTDRYLIIRS